MDPVVFCFSPPPPPRQLTEPEMYTFLPITSLLAHFNFLADGSRTNGNDRKNV
jgi:hypothetical protein